MAALSIPQNSVAVDDYARRVSDCGLATVRGHPMSGDDAMRAYVIERLMCDFSLSWPDLAQRFGADAQRLRQEADEVMRRDEDGFVEGR